MNKPVVSIVLGSFNRLPYLKLTIQSIREELQRFGKKSELIVVDGGSTDGSFEWLREQKDIITIVQHNRGEWQGKKIERRSWGYFMNLAFKCAQGKWLCMLSDDCLLIPGAIKNGYDHAEKEQSKEKKIGAVAFYFRDWGRDDTYHVGCTLGEKMYVNHGLYLKEALEDVGYIDEETFFFYNGDGDLCLKMWQKGYKVIDSPDSYLEHYPHANLSVRKTNYKKFKADLDNYLKKWEGIFYDSRRNNLGKVIAKKYEDSTDTGSKFNFLHKKNIEENPNIVKRESSLRKIGKNVSWKIKALKRKLLR